MDCKAALAQTNGDMEAAVDWLRKKGLAKAAKKAGRVAAEGLVAVHTDGNKGAVVEVNSETDFVARNVLFQDLVINIGRLAVGLEGDVERLALHPYPETEISVAEHISSLIATIGENMSLRRAAAVEVHPGVVAGYVHNQVVPGLGKIGVVVALKSSGNPEVLADVGRRIAMHIAAANPVALKPEDVPEELVARERAIFAEQAAQSGKPANVIEKMVEGRIRKFYEEVVLLHQAFIMDPDKKIADVLQEAGKAAGAPVELDRFIRFGLGEGIEKQESDFAAEVKAAAGS